MLYDLSEMYQSYKNWKGKTMTKDEAIEEFDMWESFKIRCGGYNSATDWNMINVMECVLDGNFNSDIALKLSIDTEHVELIQYILCSCDLCEYGTSPRGCFPKNRESFKSFIDKCKTATVKKWSESEP